MIFLIQYSRREGVIKQLQAFEDAARSESEAARLAIELNLDNGSEQEVVLLEAQSEEDLRKTHRRYFATASDLFKTAVDEAAEAAKAIR